MGMKYTRMWVLINPILVGFLISILKEWIRGKQGIKKKGMQNLAPNNPPPTPTAIQEPITTTTHHHHHPPALTINTITTTPYPSSPPATTHPSPMPPPSRPPFQHHLSNRIATTFSFWDKIL